MKKLVCVLGLLAFTVVPNAVFASATYNCQAQKFDQVYKTNPGRVMTFSQDDLKNHNNLRPSTLLGCGHKYHSVWGCDNNTILVVKGFHAIGKKNGNGETSIYRCSSSGKNTWNADNWDKIAQCQDNASNWKLLDSIDGGWDIRCDKVNKTHNTEWCAGINGHGICKIQKSSQKEPEQNEEEDKKKEEDKTDKAPKTKSCKEQRKTLNGKACCDTGKLGTYDAASDTCTCSGDREFIIENGTGYCRAKSRDDSTPLILLPSKPFECPDVKTIKNSVIVNVISDGAVTVSIDQEISNFVARCQSEKWNKETYEQKLQELRNTITITINNKSKRDESSANIEDIAKKMNAISDKFKVSAWKNKEGEFNTARLASDSVAAVVLGTTGGIITSNVIKKNQIQNGLEDLKCTVGGQEAARWGDTFVVGAQ